MPCCPLCSKQVAHQRGELPCPLLCLRGFQVYTQHGSITRSGSACKGPAVNPTLLDECCKWRVSTGQHSTACVTLSCVKDRLLFLPHPVQAAFQQKLTPCTVHATRVLLLCVFALQVHDSCWPFDCFPPLRQQEQLEGSTGASPLPGLLTRAAQAELQAMVRQFQQATRLATGSGCSEAEAAVAAAASALWCMLAMLLRSALLGAVWVMTRALPPSTAQTLETT